MPRLVHAEPRHVEAIYRESHGTWGAGLSFDDYLGLWKEISETPWGREHARFFVWMDDGGSVLSSLKMYRPKLRLLDRDGRTVVLGAIFTPRARRRRGHAAAAVRAALDVGYAAGARTAMLFSDIGQAYYEGFGFAAIPADEHWGPLDPAKGAGAPPWSLREMRPSDLDEIAAMHDAFCERRPFAILRDLDHWEFVRLRSESFFRRLASPHIRQRWRVAVDGRRVVGYLITVEGRGEWNVREVGALDGSFDTMAGVLRVGAREARRSGLRRFYGWLPHELLEYLPDWRILARARRGAVPMLLPLDGDVELPALQVRGAAYIPYQDQF